MVTLENNYWFQGHLDINASYNFRNLRYNLDSKHFDRRLKLYFEEARCNINRPDWVDNLIAVFPISGVEWSINCLYPNSMVKFHWPILKNNQDRIKIIVFLEDWQSGQYMEFSQRPTVKWASGDFVAFTHATGCHVNSGNTIRYTLEITGSL